MKIKFQKWLEDNEPENIMKYKDAWWETHIFWQDRILPMFTNEFYNKCGNYEKLCEEIDANSDVIGEHWSKSIVNPVMRIVYKGVTIVFRYNFYDYEIAVISDKSIKLPMKNLFVSKSESFYYQGFPDEYMIKERYEDNKCKFVAHINNDYSFYTFMYLLQRQIYLNTKEVK